MHMNEIHRGILTLLESAITQTPQKLPQDFSLEAAYPVIQAHHITALAYDGAVWCGLSKDDPVMQQLFQDYYKCLLISRAQLAQIDRIYDTFDRNGIDYMPLKGCNMKQRYPAPELRMMGDADILIRMDQYDAIRPLMTELGFRETKTTDHELIWQSKALFLELHKRVIPSYNLDMKDYFGDGWELAKLCRGSRWDMTPEDEWIYLFTHFAKHYRDGGIGCRHVVDLWVYLKTTEHMDESYVEGELEKLQLLTFYRNIRRLIQVWFDGTPEDEMSEYLTEFIFSSGSWGQMETKILSRTLRDSKRSVLGFSGRLIYIRNTLFPGVDVLREKYTILKKVPWTLPLVWIIRPFYKVFFEWKTLKSQKKNLKAVSQDNVELRQNMLRYVGLDYYK